MCIISTSSSSTTTFSTTSISIFTSTTLSSHSPRPQPLPQYYQKHHYLHCQSSSTSTPSTPLLHKHMITQLSSCNNGLYINIYIYKQNHHRQYQVTYGLTPTHLWIQQTHLPSMDSTNPSA
eukprot:37216_1